MSKSTTLKCCASSGVAGAKLKCPNPAPWICTTGSPSPVISYQRLTPLTCAVPSTVRVSQSGGAVPRADDLARGRGGDRARRRLRAAPDRDNGAARPPHAARHRLLHRALALRARRGGRGGRGRSPARRADPQRDAVLVPHAVPGLAAALDDDVPAGLRRGLRI